MLRVGSAAPEVLREVSLTGRAVPRRQRQTSVRTTGVAWTPWIALLVLCDATAALLGAGAAIVLRFGQGPGAEQSHHYALLASTLPILWVGMMALTRTYDRRFLAAGAEEFRRVLNGGLWLFATVATTSFVTHADLSREAVGVALPLAVALTLLARLGVRQLLHLQVQRGRTLSRVLAVGTRAEVQELVRHMCRAPHAGFTVVGACTDGVHSTVETSVGSIPVLGGPDEVTAVLGVCHADTVAVAGTGGIRPGALRELSWALEGTDIDMIVVPAITDIAGPRIVIRPVNGLPLLHVERPTFSGLERIVKNGVERLLAVILVVALSPLLLAIALAVRATSRGPALFRQERVGKDGRLFWILKFRTMHIGSERKLADLVHLNEHDGPLFKMRKDPRLTPVGGLLRRLSLDELPQLLNVVGGSMSLVGPRPPLASEVEQYGPDTHRRLLVKPGITGMWQVSGRSDLSWEEAVRLDLYYVDNWSMTLDFMLLLRTFRAVLTRRGAY